MVRELHHRGLDLIKSFEGIEDGDPATVNLDPYLDPVDIWTIGWGHAIRDGRDFLRGSANRRRAFAMYPGGITRPQAEALLRADVMDTCRDVAGLVTCDLTDNQFAALVSFAYNCGCANLKQSTLLRRVNAKDFAGAAGEFPRWNKAGGRVLRGLTRRRMAEAALFQEPIGPGARRGPRPSAARRQARRAAKSGRHRPRSAR
jgi:lysozyme